jgi:hypothetical protein
MFWVPLEFTREEVHVYTKLCSVLDSIVGPILYAYGVDTTKPINSCLGHWNTDGDMLWIMKGTRSEGNNSLVYTWANHIQMTPVCPFRLMERTPYEVRLKVLSSIRMMVTSLSDFTYNNADLSAFDKLSNLLRPIVTLDEMRLLTAVQLKEARGILFQIFELKSFIIKQCRTILSNDGLCRIKALKLKLAKIPLSDLVEFRKIYEESYTITTKLVSIIEADHIGENVANLSAEHMKALRDDIAGSAFTSHKISRFISRMRLVCLQTTLLENLDFSDIIVAAPDSVTEVWKKITFQIGQSFALIRGKELFEKELIAAEFPILTPFLMRQPIPRENLIGLNSLFRKFVREIYARRIIKRTDTEIEYK